MGPDNPWSPSWQPDESGQRFRRIFVARRGAAVAGLLWLPVALVATFQTGIRVDVALLIVAAGSAGVALLGAGLAPAAVGSLVDAVVVGIAMAIGAPVAAVTSLFIAAAIVDAAADEASGLAATVLRSGVNAAVSVAPLVAIAVVGWVIIVRRYAARLGLDR